MQTATFAELGLSAKVQAAVQAAGYTEPTPIQVQAIPVAVTGRDVLGIAQTGTGKTAGYVLPMLARLETGRARARMPRSLILAPTRELAAQVEQSFEKYGINHKLTVALLIGGVSPDEQLRKLDRGVDVLIATPGRLLDHFGRGKILLTGVEILVIDEADRMLDMGFIPDIEKICKLLPPRRQTLFFSATMPSEIKRLVDTFLKDPVRIEVTRPATAAATITQLFRFCPTTEDWQKREMLRELIRSEQVKNAIIFCNRKRDVAILLKSLLKHGFNAGALHGDMDQMSRMATLDAFREGRITLLGGKRCRRARARHPRRQPHLQLRRALAVRRLRAPHRPHRSRRQGRALADAGDARRRQAAQGHRAHAGRGRGLDRRSPERRRPRERPQRPRTWRTRGKAGGRRPRGARRSGPWGSASLRAQRRARSCGTQRPQRSS